MKIMLCSHHYKHINTKRFPLSQNLFDIRKTPRANLKNA